MSRPLAALAMGALLAAPLGGCHKVRPEKVPGETDLAVRSVEITSPAGAPPLSLDPKPLLARLGQREASLVTPGRPYNPFRVAEDRRRVRSYWQTAGFHDAEVDEPVVSIDEHTGATIRWTVHEGPRYALASVAVRSAPAGTEAALDRLVPSRPGQRYDLETMRIARYAMATELQRAGHGHARVYSRTFVDHERHQIHWVYLADPGPRTRIGAVSVEGLHRVDEADVRRRAGLVTGEPFSLSRKERAELDLLDTGSFASASVETTADVEQYVGDVPDSGGVLAPERIGPEGELRPRQLSETIDLRIRVNEAPTTQVKLRAGVEADPTRLDATAGGELWRRNLGGGQHHLVLEGRLGYGHLWDHDEGLPSGLYGEGLLRSVHPGLLGQRVDGRLSVRYRDVLYPGFHLRELTAGPGLRATVATGLFVDLDAFFRRGQSVGLGPFDAATRAALRLPDDDVADGLEVDGTVTWDRRDDPAEPMSGHLLALRTALSPGGPLATHRYLLLEPDARLFVPLTEGLSLGLRAHGGWVTLGGDEGIPEGPRLFGGGSYGMRGFGRDRLSPRARTCAPDGSCRDPYVGGLSLAEGSVEVRWLPPLKQAGLVAFVDAGGVGATSDPFAQGLSAAVGLGPRLRLWYLPVAIDVSYRFLLRGDVGREASSLFVFFRIGEAF